MADRSKFNWKDFVLACIILTSMVLTICLFIFVPKTGFYVLETGLYNTKNNWTFVTIDNVEYGGKNSIVIDSNGYPHISYSNRFEPILVRYARWNGTNWNIEIIDEINGYQRVDTSISLDSADNPHIFYNGDGLKHSQGNGSAWTNETVDPGGGTYISSAIDSEDHLHICYCVNESLMYAKYDGNEWQNKTLDSSGEYCSLTLDSDNYPHVSYIGRSNLKYAKWNGNTWYIKKIDNDGTYTSIALDSNENPHISYFVGRELKRARWTGNSWIIETVTKIKHGHQEGWTTITFDKNDNAHINFIGGCALMFARHTEAGWAVEWLFGVGSSKPTSMTLDERENTHIVGYGGGDLYYVKITEYDSDGDGILDKSDFLPYFNNYELYILVPLIIDILLIMVYLIKFKKKTKKKMNNIDAEPK